MFKQEKFLTEEDPLEELYVDKNEFDRELLAKLLSSYIGIDRKTLRPVFKSDYQDLKEKQKILIYLLYRRALAALDQIKEDEVGQSPKKISEITGINYNSVRGYLSQLSPLLENEKDRGGYFVPPYALPMIAKKLEADKMQ